MGHASGHIDVQIHPPFTWQDSDLAFLAEFLGEELEYTPADIETPWLTVNHKVFGPSVQWLGARSAMSATARINSENALRDLVDFRCNQQAAYDPDDEVLWEKRVLEMDPACYGEFKAWMLHGQNHSATLIVFERNTP